jgi:hypothetical protein
MAGRGDPAPIRLEPRRRTTVDQGPRKATFPGR